MSRSVRWLGHQAWRLWHLTCAGRHHRGKLNKIRYRIRLCPRHDSVSIVWQAAVTIVGTLCSQKCTHQKMHRFLSATDLGHTTCLPKFVEASRITGNPTSGLSPRLVWPPRTDSDLLQKACWRLWDVCSTSGHLSRHRSFLRVQVPFSTCAGAAC